jgi:hypothetical protein
LLGCRIRYRRLKRGEAHFNGVETAARDKAQGQGQDADKGDPHNDQHGKRDQSFQMISPRRDRV